MRLIASSLDAPIGPLALAIDEAGRLRGVSFDDGLRRSMAREYPGATLVEGAAPEAVTGPLAAYFAGRLDA